MRTSKWAVALAAVFAILLVSCRTAPLYNVTNAPVMASKPDVSLSNVEKAIMRAGVSLGWQMRPTNPGHIEGTLILRTHTAVVDINYDTAKYSITYKDSKDLQYDGTNIHSNYNGWIQRLDSAIRSQLSLI
jgi:hypothetical protein